MTVTLTHIEQLGQHATWYAWGVLDTTPIDGADAQVFGQFYEDLANKHDRGEGMRPAIRDAWNDYLAGARVIKVTTREVATTTGRRREVLLDDGVTAIVAGEITKLNCRGREWNALGLVYSGSHGAAHDVARRFVRFNADSPWDYDRVATNIRYTEEEVR